MAIGGAGGYVWCSAYNASCGSNGAITEGLRGESASHTL